MSTSFLCTVPVPAAISTDPLSSSSPPHNEILETDSDSEHESLQSFQSTDTEDDPEHILAPYTSDNSVTRAMYWEQHFKPQDLVDLCQSALSTVPSETATILVATLRELFQLWMDKIKSLANLTNVDSTGSSFTINETQHGGNRQSRSSAKRRATSHESDNESSTEDRGRPPAKKKQLGSGKSAAKSKKWACPFYQRDHHRYYKENCAYYPGFENVSRVK